MTNTPDYFMMNVIAGRKSFKTLTSEHQLLTADVHLLLRPLRQVLLQHLPLQRSGDNIMQYFFFVCDVVQAPSGTLLHQIGSLIKSIGAMHR